MLAWPVALGYLDANIDILLYCNSMQLVTDTKYRIELIIIIKLLIILSVLHILHFRTLKSPKTGTRQCSNRFTKYLVRENHLFHIFVPVLLTFLC